LKANIPIGPLAHKMPIEPNLTITVNAIELYVYALFWRGGLHIKMLSVPPNRPPGQISLIAAIQHMWIKGLFNTPIMRDKKVLPMPIVIVCLLSACVIAFYKFPARSERHNHSASHYLASIS
jgi:hypothetical protein